MIVADHQPHRVSVAVYGEFSLADYREFEELVHKYLTPTLVPGRK